MDSMQNVFYIYIYYIFSWSSENLITINSTIDISAIVMSSSRDPMGSVKNWTCQVYWLSRLYKKKKNLDNISTTQLKKH